jgi:16S rRNA (cytosine1402-N4)-methyltransferase
MRMNPQEGLTAADLVNGLAESQLAEIFFRYGEERYARRIARNIVAQRVERPFLRTFELAELVRRCVPKTKSLRIDPATRVFQALRIAVNAELEQVEKGVTQGIRLLKPGGRLVVISFHSLEDRIVKQIFRQAATACVCPPRMPVCRCGRTPDVELLTRKGLKAQETEIEFNPRSRSAVLRAVRRPG